MCERCPLQNIVYNICSHFKLTTSIEGSAINCGNDPLCYTNKYTIIQPKGKILPRRKNITMISKSINRKNMKRLTKKSQKLVMAKYTKN